MNPPIFTCPDCGKPFREPEPLYPDPERRRWYRRAVLFKHEEECPGLPAALPNWKVTVAISGFRVPPGSKAAPWRTAYVVAAADADAAIALANAQVDELLNDAECPFRSGADGLYTEVEDVECLAP